MKGKENQCFERTFSQAQNVGPLQSLALFKVTVFPTSEDDLQPVGAMGPGPQAHLVLVLQRIHVEG